MRARNEFDAEISTMREQTRSERERKEVSRERVNGHKTTDA